jgi:hypothetical protein
MASHRSRAALIKRACGFGVMRQVLSRLIREPQAAPCARSSGQSRTHSLICLRPCRSRRPAVLNQQWQISRERLGAISLADAEAVKTEGKPNPVPTDVLQHLVNALQNAVDARSKSCLNLVDISSIAAMWRRRKLKASAQPLAENEMRQAMHPADQFEAFKALIDADHGIEDIAARFGVPPTVVRQRLKLTAVSPKLMALYRKAEITLDRLMAFTVSDDHTAQEAAWFDAPHWQRSAQTIRQTLTAAHVRAHDRRARFVTVEAYVGAGGSVITDLFQSKCGSYLTDPALLA